MGFEVHQADELRAVHRELQVEDIVLRGEEGDASGLGLVERRRLPERKSVELALPGEGQVVFELREDATLEAFVIDHVAFRSRSQATDAAAISEATGATFSRTDTFIPVTGKTISDFTDPYGMRWQLSD